MTDFHSVDTGSTPVGGSTICRYSGCDNLLTDKQRRWQSENPTYASRGRFCSLTCSNLHRKPTRTKKIYPNKTCLESSCDVVFEMTSNTSRKIYCSRSCARRHSQSGRRRNRVRNICHNCENEVDDNKKEFCHNGCKVAFRLSMWKLGLIDGGSKYTVCTWVRTYLHERSSDICEMHDCEESRVRSDGTSILQVDHINGDWRDNTHDNLRLICPTCHALTDNYGGRNRGNGRAWKKKYDQYKLVSDE